MPGLTDRAQVLAWDGRRWFTPSYAGLEPPPYHVHVDVQASADRGPGSDAGLSFTGERGSHVVSDALLDPGRTAAVSLGRVRWSGIDGRLLLAPMDVSGGVQAGHLIFYATAHRVSYEISLHAWTSKERVESREGNRVIRAAQSGPALPHAIATLKAVVASTELADGSA
jgi:hypothetical protein